MHVRFSLAIICTLALLCLAGCKKNPQAPFCLVQYKLSDTGDTLETFRYTAERITKWTDHSKSNVHEFTYDGNLLIQEDIKDIQGRLIQQKEYLYNFQQQLIKIRLFKVNSQGQSEETQFTEYTYDNQGVFTRSRSFDPRPTPQIQTAEIGYEWDGQGKLIKEIFYESDPNNLASLRIAEIQSFSYDNKINPLDTIGWFRLPSGAHNITEKHRTIFIYSSAGTDTSTFSLTDKISYNYDEFGYPTQELVEKSSGRLTNIQIGYSCEDLP